MFLYLKTKNEILQMKTNTNLKTNKYLNFVQF